MRRLWWIKHIVVILSRNARGWWAHVCVCVCGCATAVDITLNLPLLDHPHPLLSTRRGSRTPPTNFARKTIHLHTYILKRGEGFSPAMM